MLAADNRGGRHGGGEAPRPTRRAESCSTRREPLVSSREAVLGGKSMWIYEFHVPCKSAPAAPTEPAPAAAGDGGAHS